MVMTYSDDIYDIYDVYPYISSPPPQKENDKALNKTDHLTPWKINMEPENDGLVQMIFLCNWVVFRFHVNLPGCSKVNFKQIFIGVHVLKAFCRLDDACLVDPSRWHTGGTGLWVMLASIGPKLRRENSLVFPTASQLKPTAIFFLPWGKLLVVFQASNFQVLLVSGMEGRNFRLIVIQAVGIHDSQIKSRVTWTHHPKMCKKELPGWWWWWLMMDDGWWMMDDGWCYQSGFDILRPRCHWSLRLLLCASWPQSSRLSRCGLG